MDISSTEQTKISKILKTDTNGIFLSNPINQKYSFCHTAPDYAVVINKKDIVVPVILLTQESTLIMTVNDGDKTTSFDDFKIEKVERTGNDVNAFYAKYSSKKMKDYKWSSNTTIEITINNGDYCDSVVLNYKVKEYEENWIFPDSVKFEKV